MMAEADSPVATIHVAGPWESEWREDGHPIDVIRCLRCEHVLSTRDGVKPTHDDKGWRLGARVGIVADNRVIYDPDINPSSRKGYSEVPCHP